MSLFAQHGHAKADRLDKAIDLGIIDGVVFGARNEAPDKMAVCIKNLSEKTEVLFDPQFHVGTYVPANDRFLPEYGYYKAGLSTADLTGQKKLNNYVSQVIDTQLSFGVSRLISPTVPISSFDDKWAQIALNLADSTLEYCEGLKGPKPLLVSFVIAEQALTKRKDLETFLDQVTAWDIEGLYLVISRDDSTYSQQFESQRLAHAMYMQHVFGEISGFDVVNGFSDYSGLLWRAAGASTFCNGWSQGLRQFHKSRFTKQKAGGSVPRLRYSSGPLLNSIFVSELEQIRDIGQLDAILSGVSNDALITESSDEWTQRISESQHWETLKSRDVQFTGGATERVNLIEEVVHGSIALYSAFETEGVVFSNATGGSHLKTWAEGIKTFKQLASL